MNILFLDDDATRVTDFEARTSFKVRHVTNVTDFILEMEKNRPDLIMLDHDLGDDEKFGTGADAAKWLAHNRLQCGDELTVIIHSANPIGVSNMMSHMKYADHLRVHVIGFAWFKVRVDNGSLVFGFDY